jgi:hypothetical protein
MRSTHHSNLDDHDLDPGLDQLIDSLDSADVRDAVHFRRIIAARRALAAAEDELRDAVAAARAAGDSWTIIGAALETSRQAAQQRFGN